MSRLSDDIEQMFSREISLGGRASVNYKALESVVRRELDVDGLDALLFLIRAA
jgi:hypothetical protein